jgi:hypothetical protein
MKIRGAMRERGALRRRQSEAATEENDSEGEDEERKNV